MQTQFDVLVVSANIEDRKALIKVLESLSGNVFSCSNLAQAREVIAHRPMDIAFCDEQLADGSYRDLVGFTRSRAMTLPLVVTTHVGEWKEYLEATDLGAFDMIPFPLRPTDVELTVIRAMRGVEQKAAAAAA